MAVPLEKLARVRKDAGTGINKFDLGPLLFHLRFELTA
jgi:hypothetical protein